MLFLAKLLYNSGLLSSLYHIMVQKVSVCVYVNQGGPNHNRLLVFTSLITTAQK